MHVGDRSLEVFLDEDTAENRARANQQEMVSPHTFFLSI
jgi:hypothetical protein